MYSLPYFKEGDQEVVLEFMRKHPFVFLTGVNEESKPVATQVPVFIDEKDGKLFLTGHIMRNNDHHKAFEDFTAHAVRSIAMRNAQMPKTTPLEFVNQ